MKRLEIFPLDSCEREEDGREKGVWKGSFSHMAARPSKTIVARTSTFHGSSGWSTEIRTEG